MTVSASAGSAPAADPALVPVPEPAPPQTRRRWLRIGRWVLVAVLALAALVVGDYVVLNTRLDHVSVRFHTGAPGQTWVIVGSDSRAALPSGHNVYGSASSLPGSRADVVLVVHEYRGRWSMLSVPRDLLVHPAPGRVDRLTLALLDSPQALVDGLCTSLGIDATHFVEVTMQGFAAAVDGLGGVSVDVPHPIRDPKTGLSITTPGRVQLGGVAALALVRSRHPQVLVDGTWRHTGVRRGSQDRTRSAGLVFAAIRSAAENAKTNPIALQRALWGLTSGMTTDLNTSLLDLRALTGATGHVRDLPARGLHGSLAVVADHATRRMLRHAGFRTACH